MIKYLMSFMETGSEEKINTSSKIKRWMKRIGIVGFIFFLLKGLAWLAVGYFVLK